MALGTNPAKDWDTNAQDPLISPEYRRYEETNVIAQTVKQIKEEKRIAALQASRNPSVADIPKIPGKFIFSKINELLIIHARSIQLI